jgi:diguanylate cyclase (GGDEF)-like protein/PAS domain S-box-containing protein
VAIVGGEGGIRLNAATLRTAIWIVVLVVCYSLTCWYGLRSAILPAHTSIVWPATGLALAACLTWGARAWLGVWGAATALNIWIVATPTGVSREALAIAASIGIGTTIEVALAGWVLQRALPGGLFARASSVFRFTGIAALVSIVAPIWTLGTLSVAGLAVSNQFESGRAWWLADLTGMVIFAPLLLQWREMLRVSRRKGWIAEAIGTVIATVAVSALVYLAWDWVENPQNVLAFVALPCVVWIALRFRPPGVALTAAFVTAMAVAAMNYHAGPLQRDLTSTSFLLFQAFSGLVSVTGLALSAAITGQKRAEKAMRNEKARYLDLYENAPDMLASVDMETQKITECNDTLANALGYHKTEIIGRSVFDLYHPDSIQAARFAFDLFRKLGAVPGTDLVLRRKNGTKIDVSLTASAVRDSHGKIVSRRSSWTDITARKIAERTVQDSQQLWRAFIEQAPAAIAMFDLEMRYLAVSKRFISDAGFPPDIELYGASHYRVFPTMPEQWKEAHKRALQGEVVTVDDDHFVTADGRVQWLHWEVRPWYDVNGLAGVVVFTEDVTRRKVATDELRNLNADLENRVRERTLQLEKLAAEMEAQSLTDQLTSLPNRRALDQKLTDEVRLAVRHGMPLSLLMLDVDHFKQYNDAYGHPAGDEVLRAVGRVLQQHTRTTDCAARWGGEEFAVLLRHTGAQGARVVAERMRQAISAGQWAHRQITVSIGAATLQLGSPDSSGGSLLSDADKALYDAKRRGRDCVVSAKPSADKNDGQNQKSA